MLSEQEISEIYQKEIEKIIYVDDDTIIVLFKYIKDSIDNSINVFCLDRLGKIRWVISPDKLWPGGFYGSINLIDGYLYTHHTSSVRYKINPQTGEVVSSIMTK